MHTYVCAFYKYYFFLILSGCALFFLFEGLLSFVFVNVANYLYHCSLNTGWYPGFLLGFSVYISNTTNKEDGVMCFKDTSYTIATIPNPANITFLTTGDMSSTTTTGFTLRILMTILLTLGLTCVNLKYTVRNLQGFTLGNETRVSQCQKRERNKKIRTYATHVNTCIINVIGISNNLNLRIENLNFSKLFYLFHITLQFNRETCNKMLHVFFKVRSFIICK